MSEYQFPESPARAVTQITYERLFNLGNYENEKLSVTIYLYDTSKGRPDQAFNEARALVEAQHAAFEQARKDEAERDYQGRIAAARAKRGEHTALFGDEEPES
jgi:glutamate formiminotransferase